MRNFAICFLFSVLFFSCEKLDEVIPPPSDSALAGKWELQNASCFCFFPETFDFNAHKITFNATANEVVIENSGDTFFITDAGTYPVITTDERLTLNDSIEFTYRIEADTLQLNFVDNPEIADDEISLTYLKM